MKYKEFSNPFVAMLLLFSMLTVSLPGFKHSGSLNWKLNSVPEVQVTSLFPLLRAPESEHVTSTTVPGITGN